MSDDVSIRSQRLDKWLWFARVAKTRTLTARLVESGKVRVNRVRVSKTSHAVRPGDVITLMIHGHVRVLKVVKCGARRGPAAEASALYDDLSPPRPPREKRAYFAAHPALREKGSGRPTKRDRRRIDAWVSRQSQPGRSTGES